MEPAKRRTTKTVNVSLPDSMREFVQERVASDGYENASEYFRELVREDRKRKAQERLEQLLLDGLESGTPLEVNAEYWKQKRAKLIRKHRRKA